MNLSISARIRAEQIKAQYASMPASFLGSVLSAVGYIAVAHALVPVWQWLLWGGLMLAQAVGRWGLWRAYGRSNPAVEDTDRWARLALLGSGLSGCIWGLGTWLVFPADQVEYQLFFLFLIASMGSLSAIASASYLPAFYAYTFPTILPLGLWMLTEDDTMMRVLGLIGLGYLPVISTFAHNLSRVVIESFRLRFENLDLLREVMERKEQAEEASREKSMFLATASHDLRQPLHALALQTHLLQDTALTPTQQGLADGMRSSIHSMTGLFDALLDMSRLDAGVIVVREAPVTLRDLFARLDREFGPDAQARGLRLRWRDGGAAVRVDDHLLASLLGNLVSNAIRYTARGGVLVAARRDRRGVRVEVWDTGRGIAAEEQRAIFKAFYQVGNVERDRTKGLGLGLAIVERQARLLQTAIELRSEPGRGSRFSFVLPSAVPGAAGAPVQAEAPAPQGGMAGALVMVVDNEAEIRTAMTALLASWGCQVVSAASAQEALAHAALLTRAPGLLICDYRLGPDATGLQLIEQLRDEFNAAIAALVVTGDTGAEVLQEVVAADCTILHKPVAPDTLQQSVKQLLGPRAA